MFYTITITNLQSKPVYKYAFSDKEEAGKYYQRMIDEKLHSLVKLIFQDSRNNILQAVYVQPG